MRTIIIILFAFAVIPLSAQTLGGNSVFNFLKLSSSPQLTALGGVNVSQTGNDVSLSFNNPGLLKPSMHSQAAVVFNRFYGGITAYHLSTGYHHQKLNTNFGWGLTYFNYGNVQQTDAAGNLLGRFRPTDWVMQLSASRNYLEKWNYGTTIKFISSNYGQYRSNGLAVDAGLVYSDTAKLFSASVLIKNLGFQLKKYHASAADDLPFDLQAGLTKRLANAPFSFSVTAHRLHRFDILYNDTAFNNTNDFSNASSKKFSFDKLFRHFVFSTTIYTGDKIELTAGYNYLRRKELSIGNAGNGLTGFSVGVGVILTKLQIRYARAHYQNNTGYNQFGLNLKLNEYFGLGKLGQKINW